MFNNKDIDLTMLEYRTTPLSRELPSSAELLFNRKVNCRLPNNGDYKTTELVTKQYKRDQNKQKAYYDRNAKDLPELKNNQQVMIRNKDSKWEPGVIIGKDMKSPIAYNIKLHNKNIVLNKNRNF